jgi:hypothetical protein
MKNTSPGDCGRWLARAAGCLAFLAVVGAAGWLRADLVEMQNGDHYAGKVLSLGTNTVLLESEVLGKVTLPRDKVTSITLGSAAATNLGPASLRTNVQARRQPAAPASANPELSAALRQLSAHTNLVQEVQGQFLSGADPAARNKFNELVGGLLTGKLTVNDIRAEARSAAEQVRTLKKEAGDESGILDSYLKILDSFLAETETEGARTNAIDSARKRKADAASERK